MLPTTESSNWLQTITSAALLAQSGQLAAGYTCLLEGLHRAEAARTLGEPWATELERRYHQALHNYACRFGLAAQLM